MKLKRLISFLLALLIISASPVSFAFAEEEDVPILSYSFEDINSSPSLFGNAALTYDEDKKGNVLSLDGSSGTYAEIQRGFFDNKNVMTVVFDVLPNENYGNYFTFTIGKNNEIYDFFRIRDNEIRNAITLYSYPNERETRFLRDNTQTWMNIAIVFNEASLMLYVDGELVSQNSNTEIRVSDMGENLISYLGKSFYNGDGYFNGYFDNFEVYDKVLSETDIEKKSDANIPYMPDIKYTFEDNTSKPALFGNAQIVYNSERKSKVLYLDGQNSSYAEIPQGAFDGRDKMTVLMDVKAESNSGNYFTFAFGKDSTKYNFLRIRGAEVRNAITVNSYFSEHDVRTNVDFSNSWISIALVFNDSSCSIYINGTLAAKNDNTEIKVSDLGSGLLSYLGKSFYDGDGYFKGYFDNFEVYNGLLSEERIREKAMAHLPLLVSARVGSVLNSLDNVSGTDSHTAVSASINRSSGEITSIVQRRQNIKAVPVNFYFRNNECKIFVDGSEFGESGILDLSYNRNIKIVCNDEKEEYVLKAAEIANNPVLPGMYADPDIDVFGDKFWIFPTTDGVPAWGGTQFHAFSSRDMVHWADEGVILDNKDKSPCVNEKGIQIAASAWSNGNAWAPAIEEKNGKYYFYYCGRILDELTSVYGEGMAIGVAWADSPQGPYTASDAPILYPKMMENANIGFAGQVIDPAVFTDTDGKSYLLFGNGMAAMADLNSDMKTVNVSTLRIIPNLTDFRESVAVFKRKGVYYFTWSCDDTGSENYHIKYGTASSLKGEITNRGVLLEKDADAGILATGHQSVIYLEDSDRCFIAYHRFYTPLSVGGNVGHHRETCIDEIFFSRRLISADLLQVVTPSMNGVSPMDTKGNNINELVSLPSCTEDGFITAGSFRMNADEAPELKASGHSFKVTHHEETCTQDGYDEYVCTLCGESYRDNIISKTGHSMEFIAKSSDSEFEMKCTRGDYSKSFDFADYINERKGSPGYDENIDVNSDGMINAKDYERLIKEK